MLSVALCTYNGERFLDEQLKSILYQSKPIDEMVICDDNSTDSTTQIVAKFVKDFPSIIRFYKNETSLGAIRNFEKAIGLCSGEIIFLSDQDDVWKFHKVEKVISKFDKFPHLEAIFTDAELIDDNGTIMSETLWHSYSFNLNLQKKWLHGNAINEIVYNRNKITGATLAIKKKLFERACPFEITKGFWHDAWLGFHSAAINTLSWIEEPLIAYRIHSSQQVGIGNGSTILDQWDNNNDISKKLVNEYEHYIMCLKFIDKLLSFYPDINEMEIKKEGLQKLFWLNFRMNLPKNILLRTGLVLSKINLYRKNSFNPFRSMLRDILKPAKYINTVN